MPTVCIVHISDSGLCADCFKAARLYFDWTTWFSKLVVVKSSGSVTRENKSL